MKNQEIIFSTPSVRMKRVQTGEYPEVTCGWDDKDLGFGIKTKIWGCKTTFSPIYMDVPEPFMQEQKIVLGVPEFKMDRVDLILNIPEFEMKRADFAMDLPEFTIKNVSVEADNAKQRGEALALKTQNEAAALKTNFSEQAKQSIGPDVTNLFYCYENELSRQRNEGLAKFDQGIKLVQDFVATLQTNKVSDDNDTMKKMKASLAEALAAREKFASDVEQRFRDLHQQQADFFKKMLPQ